MLTDHLTLARAQGFDHGMRNAIKNASLTKSAINPNTLRVPRLAENLAHDAMQGELIFNQITQGHKPFTGLLHALLPGFSQVKDVNAIRQSMSSALPELESSLAGVAHGPAREALQARINTLRSGFQDQERNALADLFAVASKRQQRVRNVGLGAAAGAGGAAGAGLGSLYGSYNANKTHQQQRSEAPLMERLRYLFQPSYQPPRPTPPQRAEAATYQQEPHDF